MVNDKEYELVQDDEIVAGTSGANAFKEIQNYAAQYGQDGPVEIYEVTRRKIDPAAAPQVVADGRAAFEAWFTRNSPKTNIKRLISGCYEAERVQQHWLEWQARAALAAAPVQAQEPVAYALTPAEIEAIDDEVLKKGMRGADGKRTGYCVLLAQAVIAANNAKRAPVQPVAVPDGWKLVPIEPTQEMFSKARTSALGSSSEKLLIRSYWRNMLAAVPAAPAAQGDAKDEAYEFAAQVIELFDDATMQCGHMLDAGECATVIRALKRTEIAAIAAKAAS